MCRGNSTIRMRDRALFQASFKTAVLCALLYSSIEYCVQLRSLARTSLIVVRRPAASYYINAKLPTGIYTC